ncbi:MAG: hypothetical protein KDC79_15620 [Cyclobacteriaceae bacterium]|nr:hypothetical protein [Cyclobacteriaceae bacterium]
MKTYLLSTLLLLSSVNWAVAQEELTVTNKKFFKDLESVKLAEFAVSFTTSEAKSASTQSRTNFNGAKSALKVMTTGLTEELMQKITNDAYADFVEKLESKGLSVTKYNTKKNIKESMQQYVKPSENFKVDVDYYQAYSSISTITVSAGGGPFLKFNDQYFAGYAAQDKKERLVTVNYLVNSGYIAANASKTEDNFLGKIYNKTKVAFYPGVQVFWHSGLDIWVSKKDKGEIKINKNIYKEGAAGELKSIDETQLSRYSRAVLQLTIDEQKYYNDAMDVLKQANTKIVNELIALR